MNTFISLLAALAFILASAGGPEDSGDSISVKQISTADGPRYVVTDGDVLTRDD